MNIFAIDPGSKLSGWVLLSLRDNGLVDRLIGSGKSDHKTIVELIRTRTIDYVVIESVEGGWGNIVAHTVFQTAYASGRYQQACDDNEIAFDILSRGSVAKAYGVKKADDTLRAAVITRYAPGAPNDGKGHKANPGFFYGVANDAWQAFALGDAWCMRNPDKVRSFGKAVASGAMR